MKLTRNTTPDGRCKYALVRLDRLRVMPTGESKALFEALDKLATVGLLEYGEKGSREEFFAIKLKDKLASQAISSYACAALLAGDTEFAREIFELAERAESRPDKRMPN